MLTNKRVKAPEDQSERMEKRRERELKKLEDCWSRDSARLGMGKKAETGLCTRSRSKNTPTKSFDSPRSGILEPEESTAIDDQTPEGSASEAARPQADQNSSSKSKAISQRQLFDDFVMKIRQDGNTLLDKKTVKKEKESAKSEEKRQANDQFNEFPEESLENSGESGDEESPTKGMPHLKQFLQVNRKKLRSEVANTELWEGFPVDIKMPRLKPKLNATSSDTAEQSNSDEKSEDSKAPTLTDQATPCSIVLRDKSMGERSNWQKFKIIKTRKVGDGNQKFARTLSPSKGLSVMRQFFVAKPRVTATSGNSAAGGSSKVENHSPPRITINPQNPRCSTSNYSPIRRKIVSFKAKKVEVKRSDAHLFNARAKALFGGGSQAATQNTSLTRPVPATVGTSIIATSTTADKKNPQTTMQHQGQSYEDKNSRADVSRSPVERTHCNVKGQSAGACASGLNGGSGASGSCAGENKQATAATSSSSSSTQLSGNYTAKVWQRRSSVRDDSETDTDSEIESLTTTRLHQLEQQQARLASNQRPALEPPVPKKRPSKLATIMRQLKTKGKAGRPRKGDTESAPRKRGRKGAGKNGSRGKRSGSSSGAGPSMEERRADSDTQAQQQTPSSKPNRTSRVRVPHARLVPTHYNKALQG